jgi:hypothetical protein
MLDDELNHRAELGEGAVRNGEFSLATAHRGALIKRVPIRGDREASDGG